MEGNHTMVATPTFSPGLVSVTFRELGIDRVVALAAQAGLASITWAGDAHVPPGDGSAAAHAREATAAAGLSVEAYGSYWRADREPFVPWLRAAAVLGAPRVRVWAGTAGSRATAPAEREAVVQRLAEAADEAASEGIAVHLEFHRSTLTDTGEATRRLLEEVDARRSVPGMPVMTYWQPRPGVSRAIASAEIELLADRISAFHVFAWEPDGTSLPLLDHRDVWLGWLSTFRSMDFSADEGRICKLQLEFVRDASPEAFLEDARELRSWIAELGNAGARRLWG